MKAFEILFECNKCKYKEHRLIGDVVPDPNELKPCPKCGANMKKIGEIFSKSNDLTTLDRIKNIFK